MECMGWWLAALKHSLWVLNLYLDKTTSNIFIKPVNWQVLDVLLYISPFQPDFTREMKKSIHSMTWYSTKFFNHSGKMLLKVRIRFFLHYINQQLHSNNAINIIYHISSIKQCNNAWTIQTCQLSLHAYRQQNYHHSQQARRIWWYKSNVFRSNWVGVKKPIHHCEL